MRKLEKLFFVLFVGSCIAGCTAYTTGTPKRDIFNDPRVTVLGSSTRSDIKVTQLNTRVNRAGFMEVQVTGVNKTSSYKKLEYKVDWIDQDGFFIKTLLVRWTMFPADASSTFSFIAVAPKNDVSDFKIEIRKSDFKTDNKKNNRKEEK